MTDPHAAREPGQVSLTGELVCSGPEEVLLVLDHAQDHIDASRAEPGCLQFDLWQTDDPLVFKVAELFADLAAYRAHQARNRASVWGPLTARITRRNFVRQGVD